MIFNTIAAALCHPDFIYSDLTKAECDAMPYSHSLISYQGLLYVGLNKPVTALASKLLVPPADYVKPVAAPDAPATPAV